MRVILGHAALLILGQAVRPSAFGFDAEDGHRLRMFESPAAARRWLPDAYAVDRTEGQEYDIILGIEKDALGSLLWTWFSDYGVRIVAMRGYPSQTLCEDMLYAVGRDDRPAVMLYAGDYDPTGSDIPRDLDERLNGEVEVRRIALTKDQVVKYDLPPLPGKATDSRAAKFAMREGRLVQVELDALLIGGRLRTIFQDALDDVWDMSRYEAVLEREGREREELRRDLGDDSDE